MALMTGCEVAAVFSLSRRVYGSVHAARCTFKVSVSGLLAVRLTCHSVTVALPLR